jgi:ribonuclease BN (tRNA processing enzyme)
MKLLLLGTTGYHANQCRHTSCFLLPECGVMLDAGTGMFRAADWLRTPELDIFLTHAHLDHCIGLTFLWSTIDVHPLQCVRVHGEAEKLSAIDEHLFAPLLFPKKPALDLVPLEGPVALPGDGRLTYFPLKHAGGTVGYRLDWPGHSMAYVTDTTASLEAPYVEKIRRVDLLVHECYFPDAQAELALHTCHSHTTPVAQVAREADVGRLVLVHVNPLAREADPIGLEVARAIFPRTELGEDLMEVEF